MIFWIIAAVGAAFIILTGRTWLEFVRRSDQLKSRISELEGLIEAHNQRLVEVRERAEVVKAQIDSLVEECNEMERSLRQQQDELKQLGDRLERLRPKQRRVELDDRGERWKT